MKRVMRVLAVCGIVASLCSGSYAAVLSTYQFLGKGNWSIDAVGSNNTPVGTISAAVPVGSTIQRAYLYSSKVFGATSAPTVTFEGVTYNPASFVPLGITNNLQAFRADVTSQIASLIGGGSAAPFNFTVNSEVTNTDVDGEGLVIVYSNPSEMLRSISILDGFSSQTGDTATISLASPITAAELADPNFQAIMSLGIGYSAQDPSLGLPRQTSLVDVNGQRLTSSAGGQDDGTFNNGGLITFGGIGDLLTNPADPLSDGLGNTRFDDELYSLLPYLSVGTPSLTVNTRNPSNDDNVFFIGFNLTKEATTIVNGVVPEPTSLAIWSLGLGLASILRRARRKPVGRASQPVE